MTERYCEAPLKITKTFHEEQTNALLLVLMDVSPGLMDGDRYEMDIRLETDTHLIVTNQSFTKIHPTPRIGATTDFHFTVGDGALLEYFPEPTIPYAGSRYESGVRFDLGARAALLYADICTPGRTHRGELFHFDEYTSLTEIYREGKLIAWDRFRLKPALDDFGAIGAMEHYTHSGTFRVIADNADETLLARIRAILPVDQPDQLLAAASRTADQGIVVRMLGLTVWQLQHLCASVRAECRDHLRDLPPFKVLR